MLVTCFNVVRQALSLFICKSPCTRLQCTRDLTNLRIWQAGYICAIRGFGRRAIYRLLRLLPKFDYNSARYEA